MLKKYLCAYPTPYIGSLDRADRCKQLFPKFNNTGTAKLSFVGQNTYNNPCKVECALCEEELPTNKDNNLRSYPAHMSQKEDIIQCQESVEVFEQYMEDGVKCGPYHVCDNLCCVAHPELFPRAHKRRATTTTPTPQDIPDHWTQPLPCDEAGFFRNPNDCTKFYRCHSISSKGKFTRTLFNCNPLDTVFDESFGVCVAPEDTDNCDDIFGRY
ncbi:unnamed protein product [Medioppia subpectinata]|uniref:Chitin-binding type-2 domain-containing protein n=1 Tax=Medioppia subpectinata TaxID=1979941 RepID=A0A7R9LDS7_9ACAR|nr:unnamed protein product [Medioppia subpectinata]CAG2117631.1 unnamed protein product [Medioppia subpectinata]